MILITYKLKDFAKITVTTKMSQMIRIHQQYPKMLMSFDFLSATGRTVNFGCER